MRLSLFFAMAIVTVLVTSGCNKYRNQDWQILTTPKGEPLIESGAVFFTRRDKIDLSEDGSTGALLKAIPFPHQKQDFSKFLKSITKASQDINTDSILFSSFQCKINTHSQTIDISMPVLYRADGTIFDVSELKDKQPVSRTIVPDSWEDRIVQGIMKIAKE